MQTGIGRHKSDLTRALLSAITPDFSAIDESVESSSNTGRAQTSLEQYMVPQAEDGRVGNRAELTLALDGH